MNNYSVYPVNEDGDFYWEVFENSTESTVDRFFFEEDARDFAKFLENGGGFAGWTPTFILQEVAAPKNLNQEFADFISG